MKMITPNGTEADVHESSVERKESAGWKKVSQEAPEVKAAPKPKTNSIKDKGE